MRPDITLSQIWIQIVVYSDGIPESIFKNVEFEKIQQTNKTHENYPGGKE